MAVLSAAGLGAVFGGRGNVRGWNPYMAKKGVCFVDELTVELIANSVAGRCFFQSLCCCLMAGRRTLKVILLVTSLRPSPSGWYDVVRLRVMLSREHSSFQKRAMNRLSRSDVISVGRPKRLTHPSKKRSADLRAVSVV